MKLGSALLVLSMSGARSIGILWVWSCARSVVLKFAGLLVAGMRGVLSDAGP